MKRAGELLSGFFDSEVLKKAQGYHDLFSSWADIAGSTLAAHSRINELDKEVLLVEADHPGWIQILQTKQKALLDTVRRRFPDLIITGISFRLCRDPSEISDKYGIIEEPEEAAAGDDTPDELSGADTSAPSEETGYGRITDEHFKETLKRLEQSINTRSHNGTLSKLPPVPPKLRR